MAKSLLEEEANGRNDVLLARGARRAVAHLERNLGVPLWDKGLGELVEAGIRENVSSKPHTVVDLARAVGLLKPNPRKRGRS